MAFRDKNHHLKTYGDQRIHRKTTSQTTSDDNIKSQQELEQALDLHQKAIQYINRILTAVVLVIAFLLCVVVANYNWLSTVMTFIMASLAFYAVGVRKQNILIWIAILTTYVLTDNSLSHEQFNINRFPIHLGGLLIFLTIIYISRPFLDQWMINSLKKQQEKLVSKK